MLIIGIVLLASFSFVQYNALNQLSGEQTALQSKYNQLLSFSASTDKAISFLRDVIQLDLAKYEATLLSNTVDHPSDLDGVTEQILRYSLTSSDSKLDVVLRFRNNMLSKYEVFLLGGSPIYAGPQPYGVLDSATYLLRKLKSYEDAPYLTEMSSIIAPFTQANSIEMTQGNLKFNVSISGINTEIEWLYTENGVDFPQKGLKFSFENQILKELNDGYFLFKIGSTKVTVDREGAIQIARNAAKDLTWTANGEVSHYNVLQDPVSAVFQPIPREDPLALIPCWDVTLYLDNIYPGNVNRIVVIIWADTGKIEKIKLING